MQINLSRIDTGFDGSTGYCYVHARAGIAPDGRMLMTMQKLRLSGSDIFTGLECTSRPSPDAPWMPIQICRNLKRRPWQSGMEMAMCDATPFYHRHTRRFLLTGHTVIYRDDEIIPAPHPRYTAWSVFDDASCEWSDFQLLDMPAWFMNCGAGCTQILEKPDGTLLIPSSMQPHGQGNAYAFVMHCAFDGRKLSLLDYGNLLTVPAPRGLGEPSIALKGGRYFLCLRNDQTSYVAVSRDGLHFEGPREWTFDDGSPLGSYNTQQHWITGKDALYLVYTRRAGNNDHIFRHRAPLFIAQIDQERLCVLRDTEEIAVPARGARLGNFGCCQNAADRAFVTAAEWMQTTPPDCTNFRRCMSYGSDNSIFVADISGI